MTEVSITGPGAPRTFANVSDEPAVLLIMATATRGITIPGARVRLLPATGHMPQIETPAQLLGAIRDFAAHAAAGRSGPGGS